MAGKLVLITGVTRGLGRAMLDEFARLGHTVLGCGRSKQAIDDIRTQYPTPHDFYMVDVSSDEAVKSWASLLINTHGSTRLGDQQRRCNQQERVTLGGVRSRIPRT